MAVKSLFEPVIDPGIRNPNFFEGRLLTAQDLRDEQAAERERQRYLARAIGAGVVEGMFVTAAPAVAGSINKTVTIGSGFAINGHGDVLALKEDLTADVVPTLSPPPVTASLFDRCEERPDLSVPTGVGVYVIVVSPASAYRDRAPKSGLGSEGKVIGCGDRYAVEGVAFRVLPLTESLLANISDATRTALIVLLQQTADAVSRSRLRNLLAHLCFGSEAGRRLFRDPFARDADGASALAQNGALDDLRAAGLLRDCDVPLALFLWTQTGIAFVDVWAARRPPVAPDPAPLWPTLIGGKSPAVADARFAQFQGQLSAAIAESAFPALIQANTHFHYLPPVGLLPIQGPGRPAGVTVPGFFAGRTIRDPVFIEGARLAPLFALGRDFPAIDLGEEEMTWVYLIRENQQPAGGTTPPPAAAFASGHLPFVGDTRFDVNRWNYSNYTSWLTR